MLRFLIVPLIFAASLSTAFAQSEEPKPPSHAQLTYSFSCPSGASGHLSYALNSTTGKASQLNLWVNGQYIQADQKVTFALQGKDIEQLKGGCDGDRTTVLIRTYATGTQNEV